jgi:hypothetical protein
VGWGAVLLPPPPPHAPTNSVTARLVTRRNFDFIFVKCKNGEEAVGAGEYACAYANATFTEIQK